MDPNHQRRVHTVDRGPPGNGPPLSSRQTQPLSVGELGPNRSLLPDGSMLCRAVPIARTGWLQYGPGETPLDPPKNPGAAPIIYVYRSPEEVFNEDSMRSFVGCAITHEHPPVPVTPSNFAHLGKGFILNTYRGEGDMSDCLMADLIVKDKWLIQQIDLNKREVSCGYSAEYIQTGDGEGAQVGIVGNHLALVEAGRCGSRCAIGDEDTVSSTTVNEEIDMTTPTQGAKRARVPLNELRARVADTLGALDEHMEADGTQGVHVHVHLGATAGETTAAPVDESITPVVKAPVADEAVEKRFDAIESGMAAMNDTLKVIADAVKAGAAAAPAAGSEDPEVMTEATATMDSAALQGGYTQFLSQAEVLVPGFKMPTFDAALKRHATVDRMCSGRRSVLGALSLAAEGQALIKASNAGKDFDVIGSSCADVAVVFKAAATAKGASNNRSSTGDSGHLPVPVAPVKRGMTTAEINAENKKFWATQGPRA